LQSTAVNGSNLRRLNGPFSAKFATYLSWHYNIGVDCKKFAEYSEHVIHFAKKFVLFTLAKRSRYTTVNFVIPVNTWTKTHCKISTNLIWLSSINFKHYIISAGAGKFHWKYQKLTKLLTLKFSWQKSKRFFNVSRVIKRMYVLPAVSVSFGWNSATLLSNMCWKASFWTQVAIFFLDRTIFKYNFRQLLWHLKLIWWKYAQNHRTKISREVDQNNRNSLHN